MKKKIILASILVLAVIGGCFLCWYISSIMPESMRRLKGMEISPDKKYIVRLNSLDEPDWPLSVSSFEAKVKVVVEEKETSKQLAVIETSTQCDVSQKEKDVYTVKYNFDVVWQDDSVKIILKDSNHQDKVCVLPLQ